MKNKIKIFFSKYWLFVILAAIVTILGSFYIRSKNLTPKIREELLSLPSPRIETYQILIIPNNYKIEDDFPSFKPKVEVYQVEASSFNDQGAVQIAKNFNFNDPPLVSYEQNGGNLYNWSDEKKFLSINLHEGKISYGLDLLSYPELIGGLQPSLSTTEDEVEKFLKQNNLFPPDKINLYIKDRYYAKIGTDSFERTLIDDKNAKLLHLEFGYKIDEKKIEGLEFSPSISLFIGPEFKIARLDYNPSFKSIKFFNSYPLKIKQEVIEKIRKNPQISYLKIYGESMVASELSKNITSVNFDNIELIYYKYDPLQTYLQPVFLITGKATLKDGQQAAVGLYLPAIKEEYLLK